MKYKNIIAYTVFGLLATGCQPQTENRNNALEDQPIEEFDPNLPSYKVATITTYPPFATSDINGNITGFDIEIIKEIGEVEGFNPVFVDTPWDAWQTDLSMDKVDIWAAGITVKDSRKEVATYTDPYMSYQTAMLTLNTPAYDDITERNMRKYLVGAEANSTSYEIATMLQPNPENAISYPTTFNAFEALLQKKVNVVVGNDLVLGNLTTTYPDFDYKLTPLSEDITKKKQLGFMVKKDRTELAETLNSGLAKIKENGSYDEIRIKWFGETLTTKATNEVEVTEPAN